MAEKYDSSEIAIISFIVQDGDVKVKFKDEYYNIGFLDLTEDEFFFLETSNFNVAMKINQENVSFAVDRLIINRLTDPDEIFESPANFIQCSSIENIVKYKHCYYFADAWLMNKLTSLARSYSKDIATTAFCINDCIVSDGAYLTLKNADLRLKRKIVVHFGFSQFDNQFRVNDGNIKRYVIDENRRIIQIDDHLIHPIDLTSSAEKISIEEIFLSTKQHQQHQSPATRPAWRPFYMSPSPSSSPASTSRAAFSPLSRTR